MVFTNDNGALVFKTKGETVRIEAWGENALRVRATMFPKFTDRAWALTEKPTVTKGDVKIGKPTEWCGDGCNPDW
ncbi:MAG: family 31 glucosidase, partial [Lachnospiraceae bacterium]|nr:family 31 glucosidase [Lachnospiraceae bacterium]